MTPADFNENLTCSLCKSYLIDAVTLTECLHFFCRSCLLQHLTKESRCPTCASDLGSDLSEAFVRDEILQNLVYKMVPDVYWDELKQRSEFYKKKTLSKEEKQLMFNKKLLQLASHLCAPQELVSLAVEYIPSCPPECDEKKGGGKRCDGVGTGEGVSKCTEGCGVHEGEEPMEVDEEPKPTTSAEADRLEQRHKISYTFSRYYRCPASTRIGAIRKLLEAKLLLPDIYRLYFLDVECNQTLEDDCTLQDIAYMFSWKRDSPMRILFTLQRPVEEEKPPVLDMETMPELVPEEPAAGTAQAVVPSSDEASVPTPMPALTVSLNTAMMEPGGSHPPIITTDVQPPPRKKRKPSSPTKKQQNVQPSSPIQRMTGVSPLAKGPPPLVRSDKTEPHSSSGSASKKGSSSHSSSSSSKLHSVNQTSSPSCNSNGSLPSNLKTSQNLTNGVLKSSKNDEKSTGKHASSEKPSAPKSKQAKAVASSFDSKLNEIVSSSTPSESRSESPNSTSSRSNCSSTANAVTHPRRIQPKPVDHNLNYDTLIKSCTLNGGMKLNSFSFDRKAFVSLMQRPPLFMDPKLASQPIKNVLSGRGMPLIPEPASYLRPPPIAHQQQAIINLMHHHLQAMQSGHATDVVNSVPSMTPHQNNISSNKATSPRNVYNQSLGRSPSTPSSTSLKAAPVSGSETSQTMTSCSTKSGKHLVKSASSPKLPPKLGTAIPTAHIQPFMSKT